MAPLLCPDCGLQVSILDERCNACGRVLADEPQPNVSAQPTSSQQDPERISPSPSRETPAQLQPSDHGIYRCLSGAKIPRDQQRAGRSCPFCGRTLSETPTTVDFTTRRWLPPWEWQIIREKSKWRLAGVAGVIVFAVISGIGAFFFSGEPIDSLEVGDCFMEPEGVEEIAEVDTVDCTESHDLELYAKVEVIGFDEQYPGDNAVVDWLFDECVSRFETYVGFDFAFSAYWVFTIFPAEEVWEMGDRTGLCAVYLGDSDGNITSSTGSARNAGT